MLIKSKENKKKQMKAKSAILL